MLKLETIQLMNGQEKTFKVANGTYYHADTPDAVIQILEKARRTRERIRVFYGDAKTGRDWMEEYDTIGYVSRSAGSCPVPILLNNSKSVFGPSILDDCIVRITIDKRDVYRHPSYHLPQFEIVEKDGYFYLKADGKTHARFDSREKAERYLLFIRGIRNAK